MGAPHQAFSPARIWVIARTTLTQLTRMRVFYFLLIFSALILAATLMIQNFTQDPTRQLKVMKDMSFFAMSIFCTIFAIVATANLIPKDIEDRTLYTILAKPVPRLEYLLGKYLGGMLVIFVSVTVMTMLLSIFLYMRQEALISELQEFMQVAEQEAEQASEAVENEGLDLARVEAASLRAQGPSWNLLAAVVAISLQAMVLGAITLCISTFASSGLFTVVVAFVVFFVGYIEPVVVDSWRSSPEGINGISNVLITGVGILFPNFQSFNLVDGIVAGETLPNGWLGRIVGLAMAYIVAYLVAGYLFFADKEL